MRSQVSKQMSLPVQEKRTEASTPKRSSKLKHRFTMMKPAPDKFFLRTTLTLFLLITFLSASNGNEGGKIMANAGSAILIFIGLITVLLVAPIFILIKKAKSRFLVFTSINGFLFLCMYLMSSDYFIIDRVYILGYQGLLQLIGICFYFLSRTPKQK